MRRVALVSILVPAMVGLMATSAFAANAHLKGRNPISFSDGGLTLSATVNYTGLGNFDTQQNLTAQGNVTATCTNPAGATQPPGQNPAPVTLGGSTAVPKGDIKNGNVTISTTTGAPTTPIPGAPGCPNPKWSEDITDVAFTSASITLFQDSNANGTFESGELVLTVNCTFSPATSDGPVPSSGFSCTS
jgi:hypothetical protein